MMTTNTIISIVLLLNLFLNKALALANCEEELCGAISSNFAIS